MQNLTKKYRLYAACSNFSVIQVLNSRVDPFFFQCMKAVVHNITNLKYIVFLALHNFLHVHLDTPFKFCLTKRPLSAMIKAVEDT